MSFSRSRPFLFLFFKDAQRILARNLSKFRNPKATRFNTFILLFIPSVKPFEYTCVSPFKIACLQSLKVFNTLLNSSTPLSSTKVSHCAKKMCHSGSFFHRKYIEKNLLLEHRHVVVPGIVSESHEVCHILPTSVFFPFLFRICLFRLK